MGPVACLTWYAANAADRRAQCHYDDLDEWRSGRRSGDLRYATAIPYIFEPSDFDAHATSYVLTNAGTIWNDYAPGAEVMNLIIRARSR